MKLILKICSVLLILLSLESCKKQNDNSLLTQTSEYKSQSKPDESIISRIKIDPKGFLVFPNRDGLMEYGKLITSSARQSTLDDLKARGFQTKTLNSASSREGEDPYATVFDQNGLLQVGDILMKISSDKKFFYIVKDQNLDPTVYAELIAEFYDQLKMDKINVDRINQAFDMFSLIDYTPFGINEPEIAISDKRPCIGTVHGIACNQSTNVYTGDCINTCCAFSTHYFFWIETGTTWGDCTNSACLNP